MSSKRGLVLSLRVISLLWLISLFFVGNSAMAYTHLNNNIVDKLYLNNQYPKYPEPKKAEGLKQKLIKKGEYLAKVGDCIACHTEKKEGSKPFAGGLGIQTPYGVFYTPNITPDKETGIGNWTVEDFIRAMHEGKRKDGKNLFPILPYIYFTKVSTSDLRAIYAYLMSLPAVKQKNKAQRFPFNMPGARLTQGLWDLMYLTDKRYQYQPDKSKEWNRGAYLVNGLGHCGMCHTPLSILGAPKNEYFLAGAFIGGYWAPNINSAGLHSANRLQVADVFGKGELVNDTGMVRGPMADVNHDSLKYISKSDRMAIATYLKTVVSRAQVGVDKPSYKQPTLNRGQQVYGKACAMCHQEGKMGAPLIGDGDDWMMRVKENGINGLYRHAINGFNNMPIKGACVSCSRQDVMSAVDYLLNESFSRSQWHELKHGKLSKVIASGEQVYQEQCAACHAKGSMGAPKLGDKAAWKPILAKPMDTLFENTINGSFHPKNGGCHHCKTREVIAAIKFMAGKASKGNYSLW